MTERVSLVLRLFLGEYALRLSELRCVHCTDPIWRVGVLGSLGRLH